MCAAHTIGRVVTVVMVLSFLHFLATLIGGFLLCRRVSKSWNPDVPGQCGNEIAAYLSFEVLGLALDMAIIVCPLPVIMRLNLPFPKRLGYLFIFTFGIL